jgi:hypothetical protein
VVNVSLDGLRIEVPHAVAPADVARKLYDFAEDLAENKFSEWAVTIERTDEVNLQLSGRRNGTHFDATVESRGGVAVVSLTGSLELALIKLTLAGGAAGVRRRVHDQLAATLQEHLA